MKQTNMNTLVTGFAGQASIINLDMTLPVIMDIDHQSKIL